jgi:hypothetical protein
MHARQFNAASENQTNQFMANLEQKNQWIILDSKMQCQQFNAQLKKMLLKLECK